MERILLPEDRERWDEHTRKINLGLTVTDTFRIKRRDGEIRWIEHICRPIIDENGRNLGTRGSSRDVTSLREAELRHRESEERFMAAFNFYPDAVAISEIDTGRFVMVNPAYEHHSGYSPAELIGATAMELNFWVHPEDRLRIIADIQKNGHISDVEVQFRRKSREIRHVLFSASFIETGGHKFLFSRGQDITDT